MMRMICWLVVTIALVGCGRPTADQSPAGSEDRTSQPAGPRRITMALLGEIVVFSETARQGGPGQGTIMEELLNAGLAKIDDQGQLRPELAEAVPSIDNGLWKLFPDGRMETTWHIRPGLTWHDGVPFTSADLLFTATVERDADVLRASRPVAYASIDRIEAPDDRTIAISWIRPFIDADRMFTASFSFAMPMPKHILEQAYLDDRATVMQHAHWVSDFIGLGPYRLREYERSSHAILEASASYVLGRPNIDEIEVRLVQDANALSTTMLSGVADFTLGANTLSIDEALEVQRQWQDGRIELAPGSWVPLFGQLMNSSPAIVGNLEFRRALYHAIDRQAMVDTLQHGMATVMHTFMAPNQPQYREIEERVRKYEYDPTRAAQMVQQLGYSRGVDGAFRDAAGQQLRVELRTTNRVTLQLSVMAALADYWQQIGIGVDQLAIPVQRQNDSEYRATFPAFEVLAGIPNDLRGIGQLHSSKARTPENNFVGSNYARYQNPGFDALIDRYQVTIPPPERMQVLGEIIAHIAENLNAMPIMSNPAPLLISNRIRGASATKAPSTNAIWNVHEWSSR